MGNGSRPPPPERNARKMHSDVFFVPCVPGYFRRTRALHREKSGRIGRTPSAPGRVTCSVRRNGNDTSKRKARERRRQEESSGASTDEPIGPAPDEVHGFHGWCEEDDGYWRELRRREKAFRGPNIPQFDPENESYAPPKGRDGKDIKYPAAVKWDEESGTFVPTTEEEEEEMRGPNKVLDPFWVEEAAEGEEYRANWERSDSKSNDVIKVEPVLYRVGPRFEGDGIDDEQLPLNNEASCETKSKDASAVQRKTGMGRNAPKVANTKRERLGLAPGEWRVVHLGTSSAIPTLQRNVSSTAFVAMPPNADADAEPNMVIVDAGENTESRLLDCMWCMSHGFRWIRAIVITHLHGDHIYGLPGLLRGIAEYCQFRRRAALEKGVEDPVIRIFGPYGTRGFLRSALFWTNPLGVRFSVSELVPRDHDFLHIGRAGAEGPRPTGTSLREVDAKGNVTEIHDDDPRFFRRVPPPHPEEVRAEDVHADEDGVWRIWGDEKDDGIGFEVVAAPLKHRLPCFGYVFRGRKRTRSESAQSELRSSETGNGVASEDVGKTVGEVDIDVAKARALGVYGSQFRVLRSGRSVTVRKTGCTVSPQDVAVDTSTCGDGLSMAAEQMELQNEEKCDERMDETRKVVVLGDTCDSRLIASAAMDADVLIHEATFANALKGKALSALHSTAGMAGEFAKKIRAKKLVLTHFSSRYEGFAVDEVLEKEEWNADDEAGDLISAKQLVREAARSCGTTVVAALDFMEHTVRNDGAVETRDRPYNRYATYQVYKKYWVSKQDGNGEAEVESESEKLGEEKEAIENVGSKDNLTDVEECVTAGE